MNSLKKLLLVSVVLVLFGAIIWNFCLAASPASPASSAPPAFHNATPIHANSAPYLFLLNGFMSADECRHFLEISANRFERSNVTGTSGDKSHDDVRTSYSCVLQESETPIVRRIEERAAKVCGVDISHIEGLQIVRYHPGQKYDAHHDYFHYPLDNQRYKTILVYLNDDFEGGETRFVHSSVKKEVKPVAGNAAFWYNSVTSGSKVKCLIESEHQGSPPTSGVKYAVNIWVRHRPYRNSS